jgi:hypothetical protein
MRAYWFVILGEERASNHQGKRLLAGPVLALSPANFCCQTTCCDVTCMISERLK